MSTASAPNSYLNKFVDKMRNFMHQWMEWNLDDFRRNRMRMNGPELFHN